MARRMMSGGASLAGRIVGTAAESATVAKDGANFVVLQVPKNSAAISDSGPRHIAKTV